MVRLRVLTLNVWALPLGVAQDVSARLAAIGERLPELDADLVALQEVWTSEARDSLLAAGRRAGYEHVWHKPEVTGGSGLLLLSRLEILGASFARFLVRGKPERLDHSDYYSGKGFALIRVKTPTGPLSVLNTHLHARYLNDGSDQYLAARVAQGVQLGAAVRKVSDPLIALGDFNISESGPEYRIIRSLCNWTDLGAQFDVRQPTAGNANPYSKGTSGRIDYVFSRDGDERAIRGLMVRREFDQPPGIDGGPLAYSDHFGVMAEVELGGELGGSSKPERALDPETLQLAGELLAEGVRLTTQREGEQKIAAIGVAAGSAGAWVAAGRLTRRALLRRALRAAAFAGAASSGGLAWLALGPTSDELRAYQAVEQQLADLAADPVKLR